MKGKHSPEKSCTDESFEKESEHGLPREYRSQYHSTYIFQNIERRTFLVLVNPFSNFLICKHERQNEDDLHTKSGMPFLKLVGNESSAVRDSVNYIRYTIYE